MTNSPLSFSASFPTLKAGSQKAGCSPANKAFSALKGLATLATHTLARACLQAVPFFPHSGLGHTLTLFCRLNWLMLGLWPKPKSLLSEPLSLRHLLLRRF